MDNLQLPFFCTKRSLLSLPHYQHCLSHMSQHLAPMEFWIPLSKTVNTSWKENGRIYITQLALCMYELAPPHHSLKPYLSYLKYLRMNHLIAWFINWYKEGH